MDQALGEVIFLLHGCTVFVGCREGVSEMVEETSASSSVLHKVAAVDPIVHLPAYCGLALTQDAGDLYLVFFFAWRDSDPSPRIAPTLPDSLDGVLLIVLTLFRFAQTNIYCSRMKCRCFPSRCVSKPVLLKLLALQTRWVVQGWSTGQIKCHTPGSGTAGPQLAQAHWDWTLGLGTTAMQPYALELGTQSSTWLPTCTDIWQLESGATTPTMKSPDLWGPLWTRLYDSRDQMWPTGWGLSIPNLNHHPKESVIFKWSTSLQSRKVITGRAERNLF